MDERSAVAALAALAQGMRLRVLRALVGAGPRGLTPSTLAASLDAPGSTLPFHLMGPTHAGLVTQEREGRNLIDRPSIAQMNALLGSLVAHRCMGSDGSDCGMASPTGCRSC